MFGTSAAFDLALTGSNRRLATRVEILQAGKSQLVLDVVMDGKVSLSNDKVRRSGDITLIDPTGTLTPVTAKDLLAPRGTEFRMFKGLHLEDYGQPDNIEWVPLATLLIKEPQISREGDGFKLTTKGFDRAKAIAERRFTDPYVIPAGTKHTDALAAIVSSRSTFQINVTPKSTVTGALVFEQLSDPWDAVQQIATAINYEAFFDVYGTFTARPIPDYSNLAPVWDFQPGEVSLLLGNTRTMTDEDSYSGVIVTSEPADKDVAPLRVTLWDTDPTSPTYYNPASPATSIFGPKPYGFSSPLLTTTAMCNEAAATIGQRVFGLQEQASIECLGHWGHDIGDVVSVTDPDTRLAGSHIIEKLDQPLRGGSMKMTMRKRRVANV